MQHGAPGPRTTSCTSHNTVTAAGSVVAAARATAAASRLMAVVVLEVCVCGLHQRNGPPPASCRGDPRRWEAEARSAAMARAAVVLCALRPLKPPNDMERLAGGAAACLPAQLRGRTPPPLAFPRTRRGGGLTRGLCARVARGSAPSWVRLGNPHLTAEPHCLTSALASTRRSAVQSGWEPASMLHIQVHASALGSARARNAAALGPVGPALRRPWWAWSCGSSPHPQRAGLCGCFG